ncbi:hypothetical protein O3M35_012047 [Rhynocoris fuscipes]|uniref:Uncharacterized protein n=1 Tax=Rhynocoris fuscipes TaxID=488301 RepID=A0AAW1CYE4_9HEMI
MTVLKISRMDERKSPERSSPKTGISFSVAALLADTRPRQINNKSPLATPTAVDEHTDDEVEEEVESTEEDVDVEEEKSPPPPTFAAAAAAAAAYSAAGLPPHSAPWGVHPFPGAPVFPSFHGPLSSSPGKSTKKKNIQFINYNLYK